MDAESYSGVMLIYFSTVVVRYDGKNSEGSKKMWSYERRIGGTMAYLLHSRCENSSIAVVTNHNLAEISTCCIINIKIQRMYTSMITFVSPGGPDHFDDDSEMLG